MDRRAAHRRNAAVAELAAAAELAAEAPAAASSAGEALLSACEANSTAARRRAQLQRPEMRTARSKTRAPQNIARNASFCLRWPWVPMRKPRTMAKITSSSATQYDRARTNPQPIRAPSTCGAPDRAVPESLGEKDRRKNAAPMPIRRRSQPQFTGNSLF